MCYFYHHPPRWLWQLLKVSPLLRKCQGHKKPDKLSLSLGHNKLVTVGEDKPHFAGLHNVRKINWKLHKAVDTWDRTSMYHCICAVLGGQGRSNTQAYGTKGNWTLPSNTHKNMLVMLPLLTSQMRTISILQLYSFSFLEKIERFWQNSRRPSALLSDP